MGLLLCVWVRVKGCFDVLFGVFDVFDLFRVQNGRFSGFLAKCISGLKTHSTCEI